MEYITKLPSSRDLTVAGIYAIHLINDDRERIYIGSSETVYERWARHKKDLRRGKHHCAHLQRAWSKYGEDAFEFVLIEVCWLSELFPREQAWMDLLGRERLFNGALTARGPRGFRHSDATRRKMSESHMGLPAPNRGIPHTEEHKAKISANSAQKARTHCPQGHPYDEANTYITKDGDRDCRACNREYLAAYRATPSGAARQAESNRKYYERLRQEKVDAGTYQPHAKVTEDNVRDMRLLLADGHTPQDVADKFGISRSTVYNIKNRHTWKHVT